MYAQENAKTKLKEVASMEKRYRKMEKKEVLSRDKILRKKVLELVRKYYTAKPKEKFVPSQTYINYAGRVYDEEELVLLVDSSLDFWLTAGRYTREFENKLADFVGVKYALLTNSGSSANLLAISALTSPLLKDRRLKPGDEVITTAVGFPTTLNPILQNNLIPVLVDVEMGTCNIDVSKIAKAITKKTKAIFVSHTLGNPVKLDKILPVVRKHNLWFIEDNCDALGSKYKGRYTGTFGHISTCSFYPAHHITTGEGGAVLTDGPLLRRIILSFRDWGRDCWCEPGTDNTCGKRFNWKLGRLPFGYDHKYIYSHIGYNLRATDMQAAIGVAQLKKLPEFIEIRKKNFAYLYDHLRKYEKYFILLHATEHSEPSWFGFPVIVAENSSFTRADIVNYLENNKVATRMLFGGDLTKQPAYSGTKFKIFGSLENTKRVMNDLFWVGVYPGIAEEHINYISEIFDEFMKTILAAKQR